jgi:hypothetical protein
MVDRGPRSPRDDFFCWKYRVWYNLDDCVFRHAWKTTKACADCEQGASNLRLVGRVPSKPRWAGVVSLGSDGGARGSEGGR